MTELWTTDGTPGGTALVRDIVAGSPSSDPRHFTVWHVFPAVWLEADEAEVFGSGCRGTNGVPVIGWQGVPALGDSTFAVDVENALASFPALLLAGETRTDVVLGGGCTLHPTGPAISLLTIASPAGAASVPVPVPNSTSLVGTELILQWATIDPAGPFLGLAAFSAGLRVRVGSS
ncbi:MAG TPA: hypothetical protein VFZ65_21020 [Planctomycetota bacterium]|nr:hypothetical protein [Planctomycetota bacterium]